MMFLLANPPEIILRLGGFLKAYSPVREATKNENVLKQVEVFKNNCFDWKSYGSERVSSHVSPMFHWCQKCHFPRLWRRWNTWTYHRRWCTTMPWHCWWWSEWWLALKILKQSLRHRWIVWIEAKNRGEKRWKNRRWCRWRPSPKAVCEQGQPLAQSRPLAAVTGIFGWSLTMIPGDSAHGEEDWVDLLGNLSPNEPDKLGYGARAIWGKKRAHGWLAGIARLVCWFMLIRCSEFWCDK